MPPDRLDLPQGTLTYPISSAQANYFGSDGTITDLSNLQATTIALRVCQSWQTASPIYTFTASNVVADKGWYVKFVPNAGETGTAYQTMPVVFIANVTANSELWVIDYIIDVH
jgi:hypothetical protein